MSNLTSWKIATGALAVVAVGSILYTMLNAPGTGPGDDLGFREAYFGKDDLLAVTKDGSVVEIHLYNVLNTDGTGTVVVMGADAAHKEVYDASSNPAILYRCYEGLDRDRVVCTTLDESSALQYVTNARRAGHFTCAATFTTTSVMDLFKGSCNGVRVKPERTSTGSFPTMGVDAVQIANGTATTLTGSVDCTDPRPTFCGSPPTNYLNCR